ncbi:MULTISPECIES: helix-turn-helix domain-containing protein [unclassified Rhizobium]|jgi:transcriptional regulator with XRE-family HTH domain|uniref:helix-turn-helix domain-containing protein n=1 Tax=unclassified Rhizobium TaxID=2613769 RepID=UPI000DD881EC|nr:MULTISPECIES: helix-turn-helix transcriptional regulator [unclassified Rhizobium]MDM9645925.1 helix-turn-helix transcriptional regulator [Rhizobium sp. S163]
MGQAYDHKILSPALCRAARGLVDWTQAELSARAGVSRSTVRDYEGGRHDVHRATAAQLKIALESGGVTFVNLDDGKIALCSSNEQ